MRNLPGGIHLRRWKFQRARGFKLVNITILNTADMTRLNSIPTLGWMDEEQKNLPNPFKN